jgi:hypothetical protein
MDQQLNAASGDKDQLRTEEIIKSSYFMAELLKGESRGFWSMWLDWTRKWEDPD